MQAKALDDSSTLDDCVALFDRPKHTYRLAECTKVRQTKISVFARSHESKAVFPCVDIGLPKKWG
jgi:hypothetical protein